MSETRKLRVFLSYAHTDVIPVRNFYDDLIKQGLDVWFDQEKLIPGQERDLEIRQAVRKADAVIVFLTDTSISKAGYVQKEIKIALDIAEEQPEGAIYIIPARLEECMVPDRLSKWQWVDLFKEDGYRKLLRSLEKRAKDIDATFRYLPKRKISHSDTKESIKTNTEPFKNDTTKLSQAPTVLDKHQDALHRKRKYKNPTIVAAVITAIATLLAGLRGFQPFVDLFNKPNPTATTTPSPTQISIITPTFVTPSEATPTSTNQPNLYLQFLLDNSRSMDKCKSKEALYPFISYILDSLDKSASFNQLDYIVRKPDFYISVSTFADIADTIIAPTDINKLGTSSEYQVWKNKPITNMRVADPIFKYIFREIEQNISNIDVSNEFNNVIFIITDGTFANDSQKHNILNDINDGLNELLQLQKQSKIYVGICNTYSEPSEIFWEDIGSRYPNLHLFYERDDPDIVSTWTKFLFESVLKDYIPEFVWTNPSQDIITEVPADSYGVWLEFAPVDSSARVNITKDVNAVLTNGNPSYFSLNPNGQCNNFSLKVSSSQPGLLTISPQRPIWSPQLQLIKSETESSSSSEFVFTLQNNQLTQDQLFTLSSCLQLDLSIDALPSYYIIDHIECTPGKLICTNENLLMSKWKLLIKGIGPTFRPTYIQTSIRHKTLGIINEWNFKCDGYTTTTCQLNFEQ